MTSESWGTRHPITMHSHKGRPHGYACPNPPNRVQAPPKKKGFEGPVWQKLISKNERMHEIYCLEAEYLRDNPTSGYLTEILSLKEFPDYIDYLPPGCIVRKIGVMGYLPELDENLTNPILISREELSSFVNNTFLFVVSKLSEKKLI